MRMRGVCKKLNMRKKLNMQTVLNHEMKNMFRMI